VNTPESTDEFREQCAIEGGLWDALAQHVWDHNGPLRLNGGSFRPLYAEEAEELGYDDDDAAILLRRESDGKVFEVDVDVSVTPVPTGAERAEAAGQLPLPGVPA
jgi:hypothetical protein